MISPLGPSWGSSKSAPKICRTTATSPSHFFEDVSGEIDIFEDPKVSPAISTTHCSEDVSGETLTFNLSGLKPSFSTSHFFEDVSGETLIFHAHRKSDIFSRSRFCEDVSGGSPLSPVAVHRSFIGEWGMRFIARSSVIHRSVFG